MIIDRFGDTYSTAYVFPRNNVVDDWDISRPSVSARVGGMSGAFDFYGSDNYPIGPMVIRKSFSLINTGSVSGIGTVSVTNGSAVVTGVGTYFLYDVAVGDTLTLVGAFSGGTVISIASNLSLTLNVNSGADVSGTTYTITRKVSFAGVERAVSALKYYTAAQPERKLWALERDGATKRWCYAKCTNAKAAEQVNAVYALPASVEFFAREGLWYGDTLRASGTITEATGSPYVLTNLGTLPAYLQFTLLAGGVGSLATVVITNTTNSNTFTYTGAVASGNYLFINSAAWVVTNNGTGAYSGLTYGANQQNWMQLEPGANSLTVSTTGTTASWFLDIAWYDTYL